MKPEKTEKYTTNSLFIRFDPRYIKAFEQEIEKRGLSNRTEAVRQLIAAWLHNPEALPIGLPPYAIEIIKEV